MKYAARSVVKLMLAGFGALAVAGIALLPNQSQMVKAAAADAAAIYSQKCASCHGADGSGNTAMGKRMNLRDLRSPEVQKQTDAQLHEIIAKGKGKMPAYEKSLKPEEVNGQVSYMRQLARKK